MDPYAFGLDDLLSRYRMEFSLFRPSSFATIKGVVDVVDELHIWRPVWSEMELAYLSGELR